MGMAAEPEFHVLAVDDSLIDRKLIERLLKNSSYQVTTVDSGSKALEFLRLLEDEQPSVSPDSQQQQVSRCHRKKEVEVNLIITDYCMPGMTGYDLLKKVKCEMNVHLAVAMSFPLSDTVFEESEAFRNLPVVIMSSENVPSRISRCLEEGAEEFFLKPVRLSDVNRLRPHMLRAKYGQQKQDLLQECQKPKPKQQQRQQQQQRPQQQQQELQQTEKQQLQQQQQLQHNNNNKRKSMDDELSSERTRPRYKGITTAV